MVLDLSFKLMNISSIIYFIRHALLYFTAITTIITVFIIFFKSNYSEETDIASIANLPPKMQIPVTYYNELFSQI